MLTVPSFCGLPSETTATCVLGPLAPGASIAFEITKVPFSSIGGIALDPDRKALPLEARDVPGLGVGVSAPLVAIAGAIALGGVAWYARRRLR